MKHLISALILLNGCADPAKSGPTTHDTGDTREPVDSPVDSPFDSASDSATDSATDSPFDSAADAPLESVPGHTWTRPEVDPYELPDGVRTLNIVIDSAAKARLDADPFHAADERGSFVDEDGVTHTVDLSYRGAYALLSVMTYYDLRNWKVKFDEDDPYMDRREWNFNYEPHVRQKLAWDLFRFAGLAVPEAESVVLQVNGVYQGIYTQYADPDNKDWLQDWFGDDSGDLYKAAYDLPYETQYFADLTWLGDEDSDYTWHYTKKTNDEEDPADVAVLRAFLDDLNHLPDEELDAWIEGACDVDNLISYLVVSNFIANWDSYPQRPKNYWLYEDRRTERMIFIPWDLDGTFNPSVDGTYNKMGTTAPVMYNLVSSDYAPVHDTEGTERPLVRRLFADEEIQARYLARYAELSETILSEDYLEDRLEALHALVQPYASSTDRGRLSSAQSSVSSFIALRTARVEAELDALR